MSRRLDPSTAAALEILESRWAMRLLAALAPGPARFGELEAAVTGVSRRMIAERLRELEGAGLVYRPIDPGTSTKSSYRLTDDGQGLASILAQIRPWALSREQRAAS
ncbi:MAG: helix-turn-helix transcriptional regulator [Actinomycetota bacterium]|nr:helix-turn-helix transcriptional regulator [Actinomycetota bacterium]